MVRLSPGQGCSPQLELGFHQEAQELLPTKVSGNKHFGRLGILLSGKETQESACCLGHYKKLNGGQRGAHKL